MYTVMCKQKNDVMNNAYKMGEVKKYTKQNATFFMDDP